MNIWRINLKPGDAQDVEPRQLCLEKGIVGVGWQIDYKEEPISWETYKKKAQEKYGNQSWSAAMNAIYSRIQIDDLIWTRDLQGIYYIGRITSGWYYETADECKRADIVNVRKCDWQKVGTIEAVPGKLVNSFIFGRTVQKVNDETETINLFSRIIYNDKSKSNYYQIESLSGNDIYPLLSPDDCEDALGLYLQSKFDYMIIPSSCKDDTMNYEYELKHRITGRQAVVQVKNGAVDLNADDYSNIDADVYLFTTGGAYLGKQTPNIHFVDKNIIKDFLYQNLNLLPDKMKVWINLTK